jgi:hypothetical protein
MAKNKVFIGAGQNPWRIMGGEEVELIARHHSGDEMAP